MPQVFQVVRCYSCQVFQVQQVKKIPKWVCKMCGEKQSLKKEYGRGTGAYCRQHVQKLNMVAGESLDMDRGKRDAYPERDHNFANSGCDDYVAEGTEGSFSENPQKQTDGLSRWQAYIDDGVDSDEAPGSPTREYNSHPHLSNVEVTLSRPHYQGRGGRKYGGWKGGRKRKREDLDQDCAGSEETLRRHNLPAAPAFNHNRQESTSGFKTPGFPNPDVPVEYPLEMARKSPNPCSAGRVPNATSGIALGKCGGKTSSNIQLGEGDSGRVFKSQRAAEANHFVSSKWGQFLQDVEGESDSDQEVEEPPKDIQGRDTEASIISPTLCRDQQQLRPSLTLLPHTDTACSSQARFRDDGHLVSLNKPVRFQETSLQNCKTAGLMNTLREESVKNGENSCFQTGFEGNVFSVEDESLLDEILQDDW